MARSIVITGGGTGIGREIAAWFRQEGDDVVIIGRRAEVLEKAAAELDVTPLACDVSDPAALEDALASLPARIDVLVNAAGGNVHRDADGLAGLAAGWNANYTANVLTAVLTTSALNERLAAGGTVVQIGSIAAERGPTGSYGAAKAALHRWNMQLARELGERDVTANVISCGYIEATDFFGDGMTEARRAAYVEETAVKRPGTPADVAAVAFFLASPGARHITGQVIDLNGGAWTKR